MDMYNLNCFVVLSDYLNYTKAATVLHISQPTLSKIIVSIEDEIGVALFNRGKRGVALTKAGSEFLADTKRMLAMYNYSVQNAKHVSKERSGFIRIGVLGYSVFSWFPGMIDAFRKEFPDITVHMLAGTQFELIDALRMGRIDVAFITENTAGLMREFHYMVVHEDKLYLLLTDDSPYVDQQPVELSRLKDETFLLLTKNTSLLSPMYFGDNILIRTCAKSNFYPKFLFVDSIINIPLLVSCRMGIAILGESLRFFSPPNVRFVDIAPAPPPIKQLAIYTDETNHSCLHYFLQVVRKYCGVDKRDDVAETVG